MYKLHFLGYECSTVGTLHSYSIVSASIDLHSGRNLITAETLYDSVYTHIFTALYVGGLAFFKLYLIKEAPKAKALGPYTVSCTMDNRLSTFVIHNDDMNKKKTNKKQKINSNEP